MFQEILHCGRYDQSITSDILVGVHQQWRIQGRTLGSCPLPRTKFSLFLSFSEIKKINGVNFPSYDKSWICSWPIHIVITQWSVSGTKTTRHPEMIHRIHSHRRSMHQQVTHITTMGSWSICRGWIISAQLPLLNIINEGFLIWCLKEGCHKRNAFDVLGKRTSNTDWVKNTCISVKILHPRF